MPHGSRAAVIIVAAGVSAATASIPARGQFDRFTGGIARPDRTPPPRFPEPRRDLGPSPSPWSASPWSSPSPWSATPAPRAGSSPGVVTQRQAMDLLDAAGFTNVTPPEPNIVDGSWTAYARWRGRAVRATVGPQGDISTR